MTTGGSSCLEDTPSAVMVVAVAPSVPIKSRRAKNDVAIFMMVTSFLFVCSNKTHGKLCARAWCDQKGLQIQAATDVSSKSCEFFSTRFQSRLSQTPR